MDVNRPEPFFKVSKWPSIAQALRPTERITAFASSLVLFVVGTNEGGVYLFDLAGNIILSCAS